MYVLQREMAVGRSLAKMSAVTMVAVAAAAVATLVVPSALGMPAEPSGQEEDELFFQGGQDHHCVHRHPTLEDEMPMVQLEPASQHGRVKRSPEHQMRIKVFYHESVEKLDRKERNVVKREVVPPAVSYWERVLKVRRNEATVHLHRKCKNNQYFLAPDDPTQYCKEECVPTRCGEFPVPAEHLGPCHTCNSRGRDCKKEAEAGEGVDDVDFILYVSALQTRQCGETVGHEASTVAYAAHCQQESEYDRPIAGHTNICPAAIKETKAEIAGLTSTVKHELLHALGFSSSLFAYFRDEEGEPRTPRSSDGRPPVNRRLQVRQWSEDTIREIRRPWKVRTGTVTRTFHMMTTPRVVEEVRRHFNCSALEGAELEDQGGDGTALTHWEKRLFQNEAMTGTVHTQNPAYSRLTFALLEDSGWYIPNYDMAEEIHWGKDLGCDFAELSCMELMEMDEEGAEHGERRKFPFCSELMATAPKTRCTSDGSSVGSCNLVQFRSSVPSEYQNFAYVDGVSRSDLSKVGSSVTLADFCPYVQEFTWRTQSGSKKSSSPAPRGTRCTDESNQPSGPDNYALEWYGRGSRCFEQASKWEQRTCSTLKQWKRFGAGCYGHRCSDGMVHVVVRNVSMACAQEGQVIDVRLMQDSWLHEGSVVCPRCEDFCDDCEPGKEPRTDPESYKEDIEDTCFESDLNSLSGFLKGFGIDLG